MDILEELKVLDNLDSKNNISLNQLTRMVELKNNLEETLIKEKESWRQSYFEMDKEGDANTKFYHRVLNGRRRRNEIKKLKLEVEGSGTR